MANDLESPPPHLIKVWRFIRWLDAARWHDVQPDLIPGPVFTALGPDAKILAHWL